jgi:hypothetical protein
MSRDFAETSSPTKLRYMTTGPGATMWGLSSTYVDSGKFADANALYTAALLAPLSTKLGPQDPWGNVKIPSLESLSHLTPDPNGWIEVPSSFSDPEAYSSLVGLPVVGLPQNGTSRFTIEATYISVNCGQLVQHEFPGNVIANQTVTTFSGLNLTKLDELVPGQVWYNKSSSKPFGIETTANTRKTSFMLDTTKTFPWGHNEKPEELNTDLGRIDGFVGHYNSSMMDNRELETKRELVYVSFCARGTTTQDLAMNVGKCTLTQHHVEASISCDGARCTSTKLRPSTTDTRPTALTGFDHGTIMIGFAQQFPFAVSFTTGSSPTEKFMSNSSAFPFVQQVGHLEYSTSYNDLSLLPAEVFSKRLSVLMNTFYQLSMQPTGYFGGLSGNLSAYGPDTLPNVDLNAYLPSNLSATNNTFLDWYYEFEKNIQDVRSPFIGATTMATTSYKKEIFVCSFVWLSLLLVSSITILLTGSIALLLKRKTLGPEIFGFVSSMTYENPYVKIPTGGSILDAMERARLLKDISVRVGDVCGEEQIGHIALAAGVPVRKLERGRLYC